MKTRFTTIRMFARYALGLAATLALAVPSFAAVDLAGTTWTLNGSGRGKITGSPNAGDRTSAILTFAVEGTSCMLAVTSSNASLPVDAACNANLCLACQWAPTEGRGFTLQFDDAASTEAVRNLLRATVPPELADLVTVELKSDKAQGAIKKNGAMNLKGTLKADISLPAFKLQRQLMYRFTFTGVEQP